VQADNGETNDLTQSGTGVTGTNHAGSNARSLSGTVQDPRRVTWERRASSDAPCDERTDGTLNDAITQITATVTKENACGVLRPGDVPKNVVLNRQ
jgi:hypothetical protein